MVKGNSLRFGLLSVVCILAVTSQSTVVAGLNYVVQTIPIATGPSDALNPSIDGNIIAWEDYRSGNAEIYGYNLVTGQEFSIATGGREKFYPQVNGDFVTWSERSSSTNRHIYTRNLATGMTHTVISGANYVDEYYSVVDGKVYFSAELASSDDVEIFSLDLETRDRVLISPAGFGSHRFPNADGNYLTWQNGDDVNYSDLRSGIVTRVHADGTWHEPVVSGDLIIAQSGGSSGGTHTIRAYDIVEDAFRDIQPTHGTHTHPTADDRFVAWVSIREIPSRIFGYDLVHDEIFEITSESVAYQAQKNIELSNNNLVWTRTNTEFNQFDIYLTELIPEPATAVLVVVGGISLMIRRRDRSPAIPTN